MRPRFWTPEISQQVDKSTKKSGSKSDIALQSSLTGFKKWSDSQYKLTPSPEAQLARGFILIIMILRAGVSADAVLLVLLAQDRSWFGAERKGLQCCF